VRFYLLAIGLALGANVRSDNFFQQLIARNSGTTNDLFAIAARPNLAVAVGARGAIVTSTDGLQWVSRASGATANLYAVAAAPDRLCAVGANGTVLVSNDGQSWTRVQSGTANDLRGVTILNNVIVAVGAQGTILFSTDGANFQNRSLQVALNLHAVDSANSSQPVFVAVGEVGSLLTSQDGSTWSDRDSGTFENLTAVKVTPHLTHFIGDNGTFGVFTNNQATLLNTQTTADLVAIDVPLMAQSDDELYETLLDRSGNLWRGRVTLGASTQPLFQFSHANTPLNDIATFKGATFAVGSSGVILSTPIWLERTNPAGAAINSLTYAQGNFVALTGDDTVLISTNGETWAAHPFGFATETHTKPFSTGIIYANGVFLTARGNEHFPPFELLSSTNAIDWTVVSGFPTDQYITGLGFTPGEFLASAHSSISRGPDIYEDTDFFQHSPNGKTWIGERAPFRFTEEKLFNGISFARASDSTIYSSSNAVNWVAGPKAGQFLSVVESNLFSGPLVTQDGQNWKPHELFTQTALTNIAGFRVAGRAGTYVATVDGLIGTLVGNGNSPAGATWTLEFALPSPAAVTGLAFAENRFVITTSTGQIFQSEAIPTLLEIQQDSPTSLLITTTSDSLQLESAETLMNPIWKPAGTVTPTTPLKIQIGTTTQLFFRAAAQ
jgi:photosystem II stability/assembly factor-like uncharacterized protein